MTKKNCIIIGILSAATAIIIAILSVVTWELAIRDYFTEIPKTFTVEAVPFKLTISDVNPEKGSRDIAISHDPKNVDVKKIGSISYYLYGEKIERDICVVRVSFESASEQQMVKYIPNDNALLFCIYTKPPYGYGVWLKNGLTLQNNFPLLTFSLRKGEYGEPLVIIKNQPKKSKHFMRQAIELTTLNTAVREIFVGWRMSYE